MLSNSVKKASRNGSPLRPVSETAIGQRMCGKIIASCIGSTPCRRRSSVREVLTSWQIQKFVGLFSIRDRFEVFVGVRIYGDDYVKSSASSPLHVEQGYPVLDLCNRLVLRE